jgi:hypothetical protein
MLALSSAVSTSRFHTGGEQAQRCDRAKRNHEGADLVSASAILLLLFPTAAAWGNGPFVSIEAVRFVCAEGHQIGQAGQNSAYVKTNAHNHLPFLMPSH